MKPLFLIILIIVCFSSCSNKVGELQDKLDKSNGSNMTCDTTNAVISYSADIVPIMNTSCGANNNSCHSSNSSTNILLDFWAGVNYSASTGKFTSSIIWDGNASNMPKNGGVKLNSCEIKKIVRWVNMGAPDN